MPANTASGRSPGGATIDWPAARPSMTLAWSVSTTSSETPARSDGARAPARRSVICPILIGPPTKAIRRRPWSMRWLTASRPPATSSTATDPMSGSPQAIDQHRADAAFRAAGASGLTRRRSGDNSTPAHTLLLEQVQVGRLALGILVAVAQGDRESGLGGGVLGPARNVGEERVAARPARSCRWSRCGRPGAGGRRRCGCIRDPRSPPGSARVCQRRPFRGGSSRSRPCPQRHRLGLLRP